MLYSCIVGYHKSVFDMNWLVWIYILAFFVLMYEVHFIKTANGKYLENLIRLFRLHKTLFLSLLSNFFAILKYCKGNCFTTVVKDGKSAIGSQCMFPFIHKGVQYQRCTYENSGDNQPWCSLKVDENGEHVSGQGRWGVCGKHCPKYYCKKFHLHSRDIRIT